MTDKKLPASRDFSGDRGDGRRTNDHAERIQRNNTPCGVFSDAVILGNQREQTHGHEFGNTNAESTQAQRDHDDVSPFFGDLRLAWQGTTTRVRSNLAQMTQVWHASDPTPKIRRCIVVHHFCGAGHGTADNAVYR